MTFVPSTAFVLAAGLGTRMQQLTAALPKPLVPLAGRPLIDHVLDRIRDAGIPTAVVNVHYLADKIEAHLSKRQQPRIVMSDERAALLDTGGGVLNALPKLGKGPFLIHNSDSVWLEGVGSNLERLFSTWDEGEMDTLMLLAPTAKSLGYDGRGDFNMSADGRLSRREHGRDAPFVFAGVSITHPRLFKGAPKGAFSLNRLWDQAIENGRVHGMRLEGTWMHVGTPQALADANDFIARNAVRQD